MKLYILVLFLWVIAATQHEPAEKIYIDLSFKTTMDSAIKANNNFIETQHEKIVLLKQISDKIDTVGSKTLEYRNNEWYYGSEVAEDSYFLRSITSINYESLIKANQKF